MIMKMSMFGRNAFTLGAVVVCSALMSSQVLAEECQLNLSESQMDFGRVIPPGSNSVPNENSQHTLGKRIISLTANCAPASKLVLVLQGAQLGADFKFAKQGQTNVVLSHALLDGRSVDLAVVKSPGETPASANSSLTPAPGDMIIPVSGGVPAAGAVWSMQIEIRPSVPVSELRTREVKTLESNVSFQVRRY
jgi:hypothetical protein